MWDTLLLPWDYSEIIKNLYSNKEVHLQEGIIEI